MKEVLNSPAQHLEWSREHGCSHHKNEIPSRRDMIIDQPHSFARAALGAVAIMGLPELLADDESTAGATRAIFAGIQNQQRMRPCFSLAAHTPELLRAAKPLITAHREGRTTDTAHRSTMMDQNIPSSEDTRTSSIPSSPCPVAAAVSDDRARRAGARRLPKASSGLYCAATSARGGLYSSPSATESHACGAVGCAWDSRSRS